MVAPRGEVMFDERVGEIVKKINEGGEYSVEVRGVESAWVL